MVAGFGMNKKTGQLIILTMIPVLIGYALSYLRYGERIGIIEGVGSFLIIVSFLGVINLGSEEPKDILVSQQSLKNIGNTAQRI
jgi:mannitol-specific phosphotransferase system IIBC component